MKEIIVIEDEQDCLSILQEFNLNQQYEKFSASQLKTLASNISRMKDLLQLNIILSHNQIQDLGQILGQSIQSCSKLQKLKLDLSDNNLNQAGIFEISKIFKKCQYISDLYLNLNANQIGKKGAQYFGQGIIHCQNMMNLHLDLSEIDIDHEGFYWIGNGISLCQSLQRLCLQITNSKISQQSVNKLMNDFCKLKILSNLEIDFYNTLISSSTFIEIGIGVSKLQESIQYFFLTTNYAEIGIEALQEFQSKVSKCIYLTDFSIYYILFSNKELEYLGKFLTKLPSLQNFNYILNSSYNYEQISLISFIKQMSSSKSLQSINIDMRNNQIYNDISDFKLTQELYFPLQLKTLDLQLQQKINKPFNNYQYILLCRNCKINQEVALWIAFAVKKCLNLQTVYLNLKKQAFHTYASIKMYNQQSYKHQYKGNQISLPLSIRSSQSQTSCNSFTDYLKKKGIFKVDDTQYPYLRSPLWIFQLNSSIKQTTIANVRYHLLQIMKQEQPTKLKIFQSPQQQNKKGEQISILEKQLYLHFNAYSIKKFILPDNLRNYNYFITIITAFL
ncbi:hypothetical protein ABPG72_004002 [Tetrahymena utriculariae]